MHYYDKGSGAEKKLYQSRLTFMIVFTINELNTFRRPFPLQKHFFVSGSIVQV